MMSEQFVKHRGRLNSQVITEASQQISKSTLTSITFKPQEDPDTPPILLLEIQNDISDLQGEQQLFECFEEINSLKIEMNKRIRTKSEDQTYTILGFLEKNIRNRTKSEEIIDIVQHFQN